VIENPAHILISYPSQDRSFVEKIHVVLQQAAGFNVWREQTLLETQTGAAHTGVADWPREIAFALADCEVVCLR
jgi:hypothetical protein